MQIKVMIPWIRCYFAHGSGGEVLWWVCLCVCLSVCPRGYFWNHTCNLYQFSCACCLWPCLGPSPAGRRNPKGKGQFWGFSSPLTMHCNAFAAKWIIQSPITSCSRKDHSVCQASANINLEKFWVQVMWPIGREGGDGSAQCGQSLISTIALLVLV